MVWAVRGWGQGLEQAVSDCSLGPVPPLLKPLPWLLLTLGQWFLTGTILSPREHFTISGDIFGCHNLGWGRRAGCYWHPVDRGQGCC